MPIILLVTKLVIVAVVSPLCVSFSFYFIFYFFGYCVLIFHPLFRTGNQPAQTTHQPSIYHPSHLHELVISYACQQIIWLGAAMDDHIVTVVPAAVVVVGGYDKHQQAATVQHQDLWGKLGGREGPCLLASGARISRATKRTSLILQMGPAWCLLQHFHVKYLKLLLAKPWGGSLCA